MYNYDYRKIFPETGIKMYKTKETNPWNIFKIKLNLYKFNNINKIYIKKKKFSLSFEKYFFFKKKKKKPIFFVNYFNFLYYNKRYKKKMLFNFNYWFLKSSLMKNYFYNQTLKQSKYDFLFSKFKNVYYIKILTLPKQSFNWLRLFNKNEFIKK